MAELTVVGSAGSARAALDIETDFHPDVVLLDLLLPRASDGLHVLQELRNGGRTVIAMSAMGSLRQEALDRGAFAFIEKAGRDMDALHDLLRASVADERITTTAGEPGEAQPGPLLGSAVHHPPDQFPTGMTPNEHCNPEEGER